jgi:hypothetical protein
MKKPVHFLALLLAAVLITAASCSRQDCGCVPPPNTEMTWKITSRNGGVSGASVPLTTAEKEYVLTLRSDASFTCRNTVTGQIINGSITTADFNSIYGNKPRAILTPSLPILKEEYLILIEKDNTKILFGDNVTDGYITRLEPVQ